MGKLEEAEWFLTVVDSGSISAAARQRRVAQSTGSRVLERIETRLGVRLLDRTSRTLRLTRAGEAYALSARELVRQAAELDRATIEAGEGRGGSLRLSLCSTLGRLRIARILALWGRKHPDISIDVRLEERPVDLLGENIDLAVRAGPLRDSALACTRLRGYRHRLVAAPSYLRARGTPAHPVELREHACLVMNIEGPVSRWPFRLHGRRELVDVRPHFVSTDGDVLHASVLEGCGITILPDYLVERDIVTGRLVPLLTDYTLPDAPVWALHRPVRQLPRHVKDWLETLRKALPPTP